VEGLSDNPNNKSRSNKNEVSSTESTKKKTSAVRFKPEVEEIESGDKDAESKSKTSLGELWAIELELTQEKCEEVEIEFGEEQSSVSNATHSENMSECIYWISNEAYHTFGFENGVDV
jgi:hypothetical protein